jgi:hypothetical protein
VDIRTEILDSLQRLTAYVESERYSGFDPYDALNSPIFRFFPFNRKYLRIIATQAMKRSPFNLRPWMGIHKEFNPKGLGLLLTGYVKLYALHKNPELKQKIEFLTSKLLELQSRGYSGQCWGYNFPWQNRHHLYPRYTPTIVNTSYIGHGFLDAFEVLGEQRFLDIAKSSCEFILNDLNVVSSTSNELCLSYTPLDEMCVYNSNALGASLLARVGNLEKNERYLATARKMACYVLGAQNSDGSWFYGEDRLQRWIDIHHTGFILESLIRIPDVVNHQKYFLQLINGMNYFLQSFILPDGSMKLWSDRNYPADIHSVQAIVVLCKQNILENRDTILKKMTTWVIRHFQDETGYFYFQKHRFFTNKISYMRWSQTWAFHALTTCYTHFSKN